MSEILDNIYILVFLVSSVSFLLPGFVRYSLWLLYSESFSRKIIIFKLALLKFFSKSRYFDNRKALIMISKLGR